MWHFCSAALSQKKEKIQEHTLRLLYNDSYSSYNNLLLKGELPTMEVSHLKRLANKVFKTLKSINLDFMYIYFKKGSHSDRRKNELVTFRAKTTTFGKNSLWTLETNIWNSLPEDFKSLTSFPKFAQVIKTWYRPECKCNICKYSGNPYYYT